MAIRDCETSRGRKASGKNKFYDLWPNQNKQQTIRNYKSKYKTKMRNSLKSNKICFLNAFIDTQTREKSSKKKYG